MQNYFKIKFYKNSIIFIVYGKTELIKNLMKLVSVEVNEQ